MPGICGVQKTNACAGSASGDAYLSGVEQISLFGNQIGDEHVSVISVQPHADVDKFVFVILRSAGVARPRAHDQNEPKRSGNNVRIHLETNRQKVNIHYADDFVVFFFHNCFRYVHFFSTTSSGSLLAGRIHSSGLSSCIKPPRISRPKYKGNWPRSSIMCA